MRVYARMRVRVYYYYIIKSVIYIEEAHSATFFRHKSRHTGNSALCRVPPLPSPSPAPVLTRVQLKALYWRMDAVKLVDVEKGLVEGWAIPFGGPMPGGKDLDGEAFSKDTELFLDAYDKRPLLYFHGMDKALGVGPIGAEVKWEQAAPGARLAKLPRRTSPLWCTSPGRRRSPHRVSQWATLAGR